MLAAKGTPATAASQLAADQEASFLNPMINEKLENINF
jgi:hypothetical protein